MASAVDKLLSKSGIFGLVALAAVPSLWPVFSRYEGRVIPVVENVEIVTYEQRDDGAIVFVRFDKVRSCDFVGLNWYNDEGLRLRVDYSPDASRMPSSRPEGRQLAGPWFVAGLQDLNTSLVIAAHRCHPLWTTYTQFYP